VCAQGNPLSFILVGAAFEQTDVQHCKQLYGQVCAQFQPLLVGHGWIKRLNFKSQDCV
jgi:hypothetical protein